MTGKEALRILVLILLAALTVNLAVLCSRGRPRGFTPPAPMAPKALQWTAKQPGPAAPEIHPTQPPDQPPEESYEDLLAKYAWPPGFELPLDVVIGDLPEVPERIRGPFPLLEGS